MTRGQQVLAQLVLAEIEAGRLELRGNQFIRDGQQVVPRLSFEPEVATPSKSAPGLGARLQASEQSKDLEMVTKFAKLPEDRLVKSGMAAERARMAQPQQQRQASTWLGPQFAPLPADLLIPAEKATADRASMAQQRPSPAEPPRQGREGAQRLRWPGNFAPLPPDALIRKHR
jgi:hypothetical protein